MKCAMTKNMSSKQNLLKFIQICLWKTFNLFKESIEDYFKKRHDAVDEVMECQNGKYRNNVRLKVAVVNFKRGWIILEETT